MEREELKKRLGEIVYIGADGLNAETKKIVRDACKELGVTIKKSSCKNCLIDAAIVCYAKLKAETEQPKEEQPQPEQTEQPKEEQPKEEAGPEYVLLPGLDIMFLGLRINERTINDSLARYILTQGFPRGYFAKLPIK